MTFRTREWQLKKEKKNSQPSSSLDKSPTYCAPRGLPVSGRPQNLQNAMIFVGCSHFIPFIRGMHNYRFSLKTIEIKFTINYMGL